MSANYTPPTTNATATSFDSTDGRYAGSEVNHTGSTVKYDDTDPNPIDDSDTDLLDLLRQKFQLDNGSRSSTSKDTGVLSSASFICDNSIDVALDPRGTKAAAAQIWESMQRKGYDRSAWGKHDLHPSPRSLDTRGGSGDDGDVVAADGQEKRDKDEEEKEKNADASQEISEVGLEDPSRNKSAENRWDSDAVLHLVFTIDLLNFSFWSERSEKDRFTIEYKGNKWTGYMSLVAALRRALDEG